VNERIRIGIVGCGLIAQVMHLNYLARELTDRFEVVALCDLSPNALAFASTICPRAATFSRYEDFLDQELDAVLISTTGSHAPLISDAAERGLHIFVEKPLCFSVAEGVPMLEAVEAAGVRLMVGYVRRYDPAVERLQTLLVPDSVRLVRVTTLESPIAPYVGHVPLAAPAQIDAATLAPLIADDERRISAAVGGDDTVLRRAYRAILIDSMVHEFNLLRAVLGEPTELRFADVWGAPDGVTATLRFGAAECVLSWVDLPTLARYEQELAFYTPDDRKVLRILSPFLRSTPARLALEGPLHGGASSTRTDEIVSYEEPFKRELIEFHECIVDARDPRTPGPDGLRDIALCEAVIRCAREQRPIDAPTRLPAERE
jgi:predicted dehydrogenase